MNELLPPTIDDLIRCVERELMRRKRYYPARMKSHRLKPAEAERELILMREVLATLQRLAKPAGRQPEPQKAVQGINLPPEGGWTIRRAP